MAKTRRGSQVTGFTSPAKDILGVFIPILRAHKRTPETYAQAIDMDTGEPFYYDPPGWAARRLISSKVCMRLGMKDVGKTTQAMADGILLAMNSMDGGDIRITVDDVRRNDSSSEFVRFAEAFDSKPVLFTDRLNVFDYEFGFTDSETLETAVELYTYANDEVLATPDEFFVLQIATKMMFHSFRMWASVESLIDIVLSLESEDVVKYLDSMLARRIEEAAAKDTELPEALLNRARSRHNFNFEAIKMAADKVGKRLLRLVDGDFDDHFGGTASFAAMLQQQCAMIDYSGLSDRTITLLQSLNWRLRKSAEQRGDKRYIYHYEIHDENYDFWNFKPYAKSMSRHLKRIRGKPTTVALNTHRPQDYYSVGTADSRERQLASNIFGDVGFWYLGRQETADAADEIGRLLSLQVNEVQRMKTLQRGQWGVKLGSQPVQWIDTNPMFTQLVASISESNSANQRLILA